MQKYNENTKKTQITNPTINGDVSARVRISIDQMEKMQKYEKHK